MVFRNSFSLLTSNMDLIFKALIYIIFIVIICAAILVAIVGPVWEEMTSTVFTTDQIRETLKDWLNGGTGPNGESILIQQLNMFYSQNIGKLFGTLGYIILTLFAFRYFLGFISLPIGKVMYSRMIQNCDIRFYHAVVSLLGKSALYSLIFNLIAVPLDVIILFAAGALIYFLFSSLGLFAFTIGLIFAMVLLSLRSALFSQWLPQIVCEGKRALPAFKDCFKPAFKDFGKLLMPILVYGVIFYALSALTSLRTFFIVPILALPAFMIINVNISLLVYVMRHDGKFYIDDKTIIK